MKNTLTDLNNYLFETLERLLDDDMTEEQMQREIVRSEAVTRVAETVIHNGELALKTMQHMNDISNQCVSEDKCIVDGPNLIRRLTPLECERLQGFPDGWTNIPGASDSACYKALGNSVAIPCVEYVMRGVAIVLRSERRRRAGNRVITIVLIARVLKKDTLAIILPVKTKWRKFYGAEVCIVQATIQGIRIQGSGL